MGVLWYIASCFSVVVFKFLFLSFGILITMCLGLDIFGFILFGTLSFLDLDVCFLPKIREIFSHCFFFLMWRKLSSRKFSASFSPFLQRILRCKCWLACCLIPLLSYLHSFFFLLLWSDELHCPVFCFVSSFLQIHFFLFSALSSLLLNSSVVFFS